MASSVCSSCLRRAAAQRPRTAHVGRRTSADDGIGGRGRHAFVESGLEIERGLIYTRDTLSAVAARFSGRDLVFIMGSDSLLQFDTWHDAASILELCTLAVAPRPGDDLRSSKPLRRAGARPGSPCWSSAGRRLFSPIRARVAAGRPVRYLVPEVEEYLPQRGLYGRA